ncbi:hypothetical protein [Arthrobacter sp. HLT1-21]
MHLDRFPLRPVTAHPANPLAPGQWPGTLPPVAQLLGDGLGLGAAT